MYKCFTLALLLAVSAFGQLHRGASRTLISGLHNHFAIPIDGGQVFSWSMVSPSGSSGCVNANDQIPNDGTFTGSPASNLQCGGGTAPTITSTGMSIVSTSGPNFATIITNKPDLSSGWTISTVHNPTSGFSILANISYPTTNVIQYWMASNNVGGVSVIYKTGGTQHQFDSTGGAGTTWEADIASYKSATAASAGTWHNNVHLSGSWTSGNGTVALPAVQAESDVGALHGNDNQYVGTIGFLVVHDHRINDSAAGFIHAAYYRAMQRRGVAIP